MEPWPRGRSRHGGVDELAVGGRSLWMAGKHYVGPDPTAALSSVGADVVVCLCEADELADRYPAYVTWLRSTTGAVWHPVPDLHAPRLEEAVVLLDRLAGLIDGGHTLLLHCGAGYGRTGTVAAGLLLHYGAGLEDALAAVADARPGAGPEVGAQRSLLEELARR